MALYSLPNNEQATLDKAIIETGAHSLREGGYDPTAWHVVVPILNRPDFEKYMWTEHGMTVSSDMFELPTRKQARRLVHRLAHSGISAWISTARTLSKPELTIVNLAEKVRPTR